jgi:ribosome-associated protein
VKQTRTPARPATRPARRAKRTAKRAAPATLAGARRVAGFALEKKAADVRLLDLRKVTDVTRFFILCTGTSSAQVKAIADHVIDKCEQTGVSVYNVEGYESLRWVLLDMIDMVVHIFQPDVRDYYQLERLWGDAPAERLTDSGVEAAG